MALCFLAAACGERQASIQEQSLAFVSDWFTQARAGATDETLCHGMGLLKHPEISCDEMLEHAGRIDPATRQVTGLRQRDCFGDVCGEFVEINFESRDMAGNELQETALLKRDGGTLRLYWYRSDSLLALLRPVDDPGDREDKDPLQVAYDEITARYPSLYSYPPCYGVRPSSSNLIGELVPKHAIDVQQVEQRAAECGENFCLALVGNKIATLCPAR